MNTNIEKIIDGVISPSSEQSFDELNYIYLNTKLRGVQDAVLRLLHTNNSVSTNTKIKDIEAVTQYIFDKTKDYKTVVGGYEFKNTKFITNDEFNKLVKKANITFGTNIVALDIITDGIVNMSAGISISSVSGIRNFPQVKNKFYNIKLIKALH